MHVGTTITKSKTEAMYFPTSLTESRNQEHDQTTPDPIYLNNGQNQIQFASSFKYLGSIIMSNLTKDAEIQARIKKHRNKWEGSIISFKTVTLTRE